MGLLTGRNVVREGSIRFEGQELVGRSGKEMRHIWGQEMSMIFQDPMTSLNPLMKIGKQITEPLKAHLDMKGARRRARRPSSCCATSRSRRRRAASASTRTSCRAACASG